MGFYHPGSIFWPTANDAVASIPPPGLRRVAILRGAIHTLSATGLRLTMARWLILLAVLGTLHGSVQGKLLDEPTYLDIGTLTDLTEITNADWHI
jgi:hypothetical protein